MNKTEDTNASGRGSEFTEGLGLAPERTRVCPLAECRGRPRCSQCRMLDEMYPPQRNMSGRGDVPAEAEAEIPMARLIELETAEHERDILRAENAALKREAHTWSKAAEHYAKRLAAREGRAEDLYDRLHSLSKSMESSGRIDEHQHPDAYGTILDAMKYVQQSAGPETQPGATTFDGADAWNAHGA